MAASTSQPQLMATPAPAIEPNQAPVASQTDHHNASTPRSPAQATTANVRQAYPNVYSEPPPQNWYYYDPTRHWRSSSHLFTTPLPMPPPVLAPSQSGGSATDSVLGHLWASLKALQSQFTAFQESIGNVNSDVKDALSQLRTLRTAQNKTEKSIAGLEGAIGVASAAKSRSGRTKGRGKAVPDAESVDTATVPEYTLVQSVALIQSAIQVLLARENQASQSRMCLFSLRQSFLIYCTAAPQTETSTLLPPNILRPESFHASSHLMDSHQQFSKLQSTQLISPTPQSGLSHPSFHVLPGKGLSMCTYATSCYFPCP